MALVGEIATLITARTEPFEKGMKRAGKSTKKFSNDVKGTSQTLKKDMGGALRKVSNFLSGPAGLAIGFASVTGAVKKFASSILEEGQALDAIGKLSTRIGVSTRDLTAFEFIAGQTGASFAAVSKGLEAFSKRTGEAANGTGEAVKAFELLDINAREFLELPMIERFTIIADKIGEFGTEAEQAAVASKLFSRVGQGEMLNMLKLGKSGIEDLTATAERLGIVMGDDVVKAIERSNDAMDRMSQRADGLYTQLTGDLVPVLGALIEDIESVGERTGLDEPDPDKTMGRKVLEFASHIGGIVPVSPGGLFRKYLDRVDTMTLEEQAKLDKQAAIMELNSRKQDRKRMESLKTIPTVDDKMKPPAKPLVPPSPSIPKDTPLEHTHGEREPAARNVPVVITDPKQIAAQQKTNELLSDVVDKLPDTDAEPIGVIKDF